LSVLAQTTAGLPPASRADPAREPIRERDAKLLQTSVFCRRFRRLEGQRPRSSRADPACGMAVLRFLASSRQRHPGEFVVPAD
jgi:hypothetical protein